MTYEEIIEVEAVKERFMGNYNMFSMYLFQFAEGALFQSLQEVLKNGTVEEAFDVAHDMKGVVLNLSLKQLECPMLLIVNSLRSGKLPDEAVWNALVDGYEKTVTCIQKIKEEGVVLF